MLSREQTVLFRNGLILALAVCVGTFLADMISMLTGWESSEPIALLLSPTLMLLEQIFPSRAGQLDRTLLSLSLLVSFLLTALGGMLLLAVRSMVINRLSRNESVPPNATLELGWCLKLSGVVLATVMAVNFSIPHLVRSTVPMLDEVRGLRYSRQQRTWREYSESAPVVVIGTVESIETEWGPSLVGTYLPSGQYVVRDLRRQWVQFSVEQTLRGVQIADTLRFYQWIELSQSHALLALDQRLLFDPLGSSAIGRGRYVFFLTQEDGAFRAHRDIGETGFRIRSGEPNLPVAGGQPLNQLLARILLTPADEDILNEFVKNLHESFTIISTLVDEEDARNYVEGLLLAHPSPEVRGEACLATNPIYRELFKTCVTDLLDGPPSKFQQRARATLDREERDLAKRQRMIDAYLRDKQSKATLPLPPSPH